MTEIFLTGHRVRVSSVILMLIVCFGAQGSSASPYSLPISERPFLLGVVPIPRNFPHFRQEDLIDAYEMTSEIAEVVPVPDPQSWIGKTEKLKKNRVIQALRDTYKLVPIISLGIVSVQVVGGKHQVVVEVPSDMPRSTTLEDEELRRRWVEEAAKIAREFKPEYLQLGNEVNFIYEVDPDAFDAYVSLYKEAYDAVKKTSPNTKVFPVFSYNLIVRNSRWGLFEKLEGKYDLLGLTTYPWMIYDNPDQIPNDYYRQMEAHTDKPVAFNEIGWGSSADYGGSEEEQVNYLIRFLELTRGMDLEFVNWLLLHDLSPQAIGGAVQPQHVSLGMRRNNGEPKPVYDAWRELKDLPYTGRSTTPKGIGPSVIILAALVATGSLSLIYVARRIRRRRRKST